MTVILPTVGEATFIYFDVHGPTPSCALLCRTALFGVVRGFFVIQGYVPLRVTGGACDAIVLIAARSGKLAHGPVLDSFVSRISGIRVGVHTATKVSGGNVLVGQTIWTGRRSTKGLLIKARLASGPERIP